MVVSWEAKKKHHTYESSYLHMRPLQWVIYKYIVDGWWFFDIIYIVDAIYVLNVVLLFVIYKFSYDSLQNL